MLGLILEAAFRSMLMALAVWGCVRLLRVEAVLAQKLTWVLVLLAAAAMPVVMRAPFLAANRALQIPLSQLPWVHKQAVVAPVAAAVTNSPVRQAVIKAKPSAAHVSLSTASVAAAPVVQASERVSNAVESVAAVPNPAMQLLETLWGKAVGYWHSVRIGVLAVGLYLAVCGLLMLRTLVGLAVALRLVARSRAVAVADGLNVRASRDMRTPVTIGSTVLLPADYAEWDAEKLRIVLAHEQSHVRQGDFYLQLVAAVHAAIFWFSPLGWWLQRKLSELGEALSDRAGLEQASSAAAYAEVLLEFAAMPRKQSIFQPVAGVAMARSSNLAGRIERVLNAANFRPMVLGGRRHAVVAAVLVPVALVAVVAGIRIVPAVEAAAVHGTLAAQLAPAAPEVAAPAPPAPPAPAPPAPRVEAPEPPEPDSEVGEANSNWDDDGESFAIVSGDKDRTIHINNDGGGSKDFEKARQKYHGNFIWFERDGKSYVITDPAMVAKAQAQFKMDGRLEVRQKELSRLQANLDKQMAELRPEIEKAAKPGPEFEAQMKKLNAELAKLQSEDFKKLTAEISKEAAQEKLAELQEKIGDIQGQLGDIQGQIGERQGLVGEKQGELGEQMGKLGEEMGHIGEQQGKKAEEAVRKMKPMLDQAVKDGKAKPVE